MDLISLIIVLVVVGIALWLINAYVPMDYKIKRILNIAVVVVVVIWLLGMLLGGTNLGGIRIGD